MSAGVEDVLDFVEVSPYLAVLLTYRRYVSSRQAAKNVTRQ